MKAIVLVLSSAWMLSAGAAREGSPAQAPDFALPDLDGEVHHLGDSRGRVVVLEWTNHACPAVAAVHETRIAGDTIAALDATRVSWLQVDSSWFAPALAEDVRGWKKRLGIEVPTLLDSDAAVARSFGIEATPTYVVIDPEGRIVYRGALHDSAPEPERRNWVIEAVDAVLSGREVARARTRAVGCSIKAGQPRESVDRAEIEDDSAAGELYREAADAASAGDFAAALALLERAFEARHPRPWSVVADGAFADLVNDGEARRRLRALLGERPARGRLSMVRPGEPGEALVLSGTVRSAAGDPIQGAVVSLYHTDAAGWYKPGSIEGDNARLFGRVATDAKGRYRIRTIVPGYYANTRGGLIHVHMGTEAEGFRAHGGHRASVYFDDDPNLTGANRAEIVGDGCAIRARTENAEGVVLCVHDIRLTPE